MEEDDALTVDDDDDQEQDDVTDAHSIHQKLLHASASHAAATSCASQLVRQAGPFVGSPLSPHHLGELNYLMIITLLSQWFPCLAFLQIVYYTTDLFSGNISQVVEKFISELMCFRDEDF